MSNFKQLEDQRNDAKSQDRNSPNTARQAFGLLMNSFLTVESQRTNLFIHTDAEEKKVFSKCIEAKIEFLFVHNC